MKIWKLLGVAGLAGVAAGGAIIARDQRQRAQLTPDEVRERLHQRLAESESTNAVGDLRRISAVRECASSRTLRRRRSRP